MDTGILSGEIDLNEIIPLIIIASAQYAGQSNTQDDTTTKVSISGADYLGELLDCGNDKYIYGVLRMRNNP